MFGTAWCGQMGIGGWLAMAAVWGTFIALVAWAITRMFPHRTTVERRHRSLLRRSVGRGTDPRRILGAPSPRDHRHRSAISVLPDADPSPLTRHDDHESWLIPHRATPGPPAETPRRRPAGRTTDPPAVTRKFQGRRVASARRLPGRAQPRVARAEELLSLHPIRMTESNRTTQRCYSPDRPGAGRSPSGRPGPGGAEQQFLALTRPVSAPTANANMNATTSPPSRNLMATASRQGWSSSGRSRSSGH
jgi:hypothetical protein